MQINNTFAAFLVSFCFVSSSGFMDGGKLAADEQALFNLFMIVHQARKGKSSGLPFQLYDRY